MRTAWLDGTNPIADDFTVANGAVIGTIDGTAVDRGSRYPGVDALTMIFWYGSTDAPITLTFGAAGLNTFIYVGEITVDGVIGRAYRGVVTYRAALVNGTVLSLVLPAQSGRCYHSYPDLG